VTDSHDLIAFCGIYCGACSFKLAFDENDRRHLQGMPEKYREHADAPLQFCPGCRRDAHDGDCAIRQCARQRGLIHCGQCAEFRCAWVRSFESDGVPHHVEAARNLARLKDVGIDVGGRELAQRMICSCGARRSWYLEKCTRCGRKF